MAQGPVLTGGARSGANHLHQAQDRAVGAGNKQSEALNAGDADPGSRRRHQQCDVTSKQVTGEKSPNSTQKEQSWLT